MLSTLGLVFTPLKLGYSSLKSIDQGWREKLGGQGAFTLLVFGSTLIQWLQNNRMKIYLSIFVIWLVVIMGLRFGT